jgi:hypothetical protein
MQIDVAFFEKYLVNDEMYCVNDHSHAMGLQWKFVCALFLFLDKSQDGFSGPLWLFDSL